jgi:hypothetical protein
MGCRKFAVQVALGAVLLLPLHAAWAGPSQSDAPLSPCSLSQVADRFDDGDTGDDAMPDRDMPPQACASGTAAGVSKPDNTIFFTPVLQDHEDLEDDTTTPVRHLTPTRPTRAASI